MLIVNSNLNPVDWIPKDGSGPGHLGCSLTSFELYYVLPMPKYILTWFQEVVSKRVVLNLRPRFLGSTLATFALHGVLPKTKGILTWFQEVVSKRVVLNLRPRFLGSTLATFAFYGELPKTKGILTSVGSGSVEKSGSESET